ncbi:hypothetical protein D2E23_1198 [Bifidobacterium callimiconis]|uniref:Uncharacterized protein n=1 Tax=Bifidobacterium callimiconis TaxID=2306973 RepID=A0A430FDK8_9BIFI|nr:hypothetical protein D2E23_1198 [Bifidobacterium callimiconis]
MAGVCKRVPKMGNSHKLHSPEDYDCGELRFALRRLSTAAILH